MENFNDEEDEAKHSYEKEDSSGYPEDIIK